MDQERELAARERLRARESRFQKLMKDFPEGASIPPEDLITAIVEIEDLRNELEFLENGSSDPDEPDALVGAPVKPLPHLNSGAIGFSELDELEC